MDTCRLCVIRVPNVPDVADLGSLLPPVIYSYIKTSLQAGTTYGLCMANFDGLVNILSISLKCCVYYSFGDDVVNAMLEVLEDVSRGMGN